MYFLAHKVERDSISSDLTLVLESLVYKLINPCEN